MPRDAAGVTLSLRATVSIPVPIERAWEVWVDASRYPQWQGGVLAVQDLTGRVGEVGTTYVLDHGPKLKRQVRVVAAEPPVRHVIEQTGVGVHDQTAATFEPDGEGTLVTLVTYAHMNAVLRFFSRLDVRGWSQREFQRELDRFAAVAVRQPGPARVGGVYLARAAATRRRLTVIGVDPDRIHVRLHPGHLRDRDPDDLVPSAPKPPSDQMDLWPISPPLRAPIDISTRGLPFLVRDGGHGVDHLALSLDAWADADPSEVGAEEVSDGDLAAVDHWRRRGGPVVGIDAELALAPLCTLRLGVDDAGAEVWGVAKVLRSEILKIHLAIPGDRWSERPAGIDTWRSRVLPKPLDADPELPADPDATVGIGHAPVDRSAFSNGKPVFAGIATLESDELEGYRMWRDAKGGTFSTLQLFAVPPTIGMMLEAAEREHDEP